MKFLKQKINTGFGIFFILLVGFVGIAIVWKPWGDIILFGGMGIFFLSFTINFLKARLPYLAILLAIVSLICFLDIPFKKWSGRLIFIPAILTIIIWQIEKKSHPERVVKWEEWSKKVSFLDFLLCKYKG